MAPEKIKNGLIVDNRNKKKGFDCGKRYVLAFMREFINYVRNDSDVC